MAVREIFGACEKLEVAGDGDMGIGREARVSSNANWDSDGSETSAGRTASESKGGGSITTCLAAIQFHPTGMLPNLLKYIAAA